MDKVKKQQSFFLASKNSDWKLLSMCGGRPRGGSQEGRKSQADSFSTDERVITQ